MPRRTRAPAAWGYVPAGRGRWLPGAWIGAATHVVWDNWTHQYGYFVHQFPLLRSSLGHGLSTHNVLQQLSTGAGLLIVAIALST